MIGIQGETALDEVTKSPADAALSTTSTNSVQNKVVTKSIIDLKDSLDNKENKLKSVYVTELTTDAHGRITTDIDISNKAVVGILTNINGDIAIQFRSSINVLAFIIIDSFTFQPVANAKRYFTYYYFDI